MLLAPISTYVSSSSLSFLRTAEGWALLPGMGDSGGEEQLQQLATTNAIAPTATGEGIAAGVVTLEQKQPPAASPTEDETVALEAAVPAVVEPSDHQKRGDLKEVVTEPKSAAQTTAEGRDGDVQGAGATVDAADARTIPTPASSRPVSAATTTRRPTSALGSGIASSTRPTSAALEDPLLSLVIRPCDKQWVMGEDWHTEVSALLTINDLRAHIEQHKQHVSRFRMQLRIRDKIVVPARDNWTLRRIGISDHTVIQVEPTLSGSWYWEDRNYYAEKLLGEVQAQIQAAGGTAEYAAVSEAVSCPPPIKSSLRVFLKTYPDRIHLTTDLTSGAIWLQETKHPYQLPTYDTIPVEIGRLQHHQPAQFDWEAHRDVDDMYQLEEMPDLPEDIEKEEDREGKDKQNEEQPSSREEKAGNIESSKDPADQKTATQQENEKKEKEEEAQREAAADEAARLAIEEEDEKAAAAAL